MPHKHTRSSRINDSSSYDLPPSAIARPLPVVKSPSSKQSSNKKRNHGKERHDDTPRAFTRMLNYQKNGRHTQSLDDEDQRSNKRRKFSSQTPSKDAKSTSDPKTASTRVETPTTSTAQRERLTILPGERMSDFSARVNQAMPVSGLTRTKKQIGKLGLGKAMTERKTRMEKRMHKMQAQWREEEAKIKEKEEEARDIAEEAEAEHWGVSRGIPGDAHGGRSSKRKRRQGGVAGTTEDGEDPWAQLKLARQQPKGLNDFVKEPPKLIGVREKLKIRNGATVDVADIPGAAGSLRRREELGSARKDIIEAYRKLMQTKRDQA